MTVADAVHKWTNKALDYAKTKDNLRGLAGSNLFALPLILNKGEMLNKLKSFQKQFAEFGNLEEYYNILQSDVNLSPQASAQIAYPPSAKINDYIDSIKTPAFQGTGFKRATERSSAYADKILELGVTNRDSLLSIMRSIQEKDPYFDQNAFLDVFKKIARLYQARNDLIENFKRRSNFAKLGRYSNLTNL